MSEEHGQVIDEELSAENEARRRLALAQIRQWPDPVLKLRAEEVEDFDDDLRRLVARMQALMADAHGIGLAGNQAGVLRRLFVFRIEDEDEARAAVNPAIVDASEELETADEGCLSLQGVLVPVERPRAVTLEAHDAEGTPFRAGAGRARRQGRPARARPPRRRPDPGADDTRGPARGNGDTAAAADPRLGMRVGFAASAPFGADVLERLAARHEIAFCLTQPDAPAGRGRGLRPTPAKLTALKLGIPVVESLDETLDEPTIVLVAYGRLIPNDLLERHLWLNVHPSLLPRWRGAAPVERAIMAGDTETGVTVIKLVEELDAGPIAAQERFPIDPEDDAGAVYDRAVPLAVELLERMLPDPAFTSAARRGSHLRRRRSARRTGTSTSRSRRRR